MSKAIAYASIASGPIAGEFLSYGQSAVEVVSGAVSFSASAVDVGDAVPPIEVVATGVTFSCSPVDATEYAFAIEPASGAIGFFASAAIDVAWFISPGNIEIAIDNKLLLLSAQEPADLPYIANRRHFKPELLFPGYSSDSANITIPIAIFQGLSAEEADAVTGDCRKILQAIFLRAVECDESFVWSGKARTYEPFKMDLLNSRTFDRHFLFHFYTDMGEPNVAPEP